MQYCSVCTTSNICTKCLTGNVVLGGCSTVLGCSQVEQDIIAKSSKCIDCQP